MTRSRQVLLSILALVLTLGVSEIHAQPIVNELSPAETRADAEYLNMIAVSQRDSELARRNAILEAKADIEQASYARLEVLVGLIGILLAIVVIGFGFNTREVAIAAAKRGIENERDGITKISEELLQRHQEIQNLSSLVREQRVEMESQAAALYDSIIKSAIYYAPGDFHPDTSISDRSSILSMRQEAQSLSPEEMTVHQYKILMASAVISSEWGMLVSYANELRSTKSDALACLAACLSEAVGLSESGKALEAYDTCRQAVATYNGTSGADAARYLATISYYSAIVAEALSPKHFGEEEVRGIFEELVVGYQAMASDEEIGGLTTLATGRLRAKPADLSKKRRRPTVG